MSDNTPIISIGLITFFGTSIATALIKPVGEMWHRGTFDPATGVTIDTDLISLHLHKPTIPSEKGPRLVGTLLLKQDGSVLDIAGWRAKTEDGRTCIGLSINKMPEQPADSPF